MSKNAVKGKRFKHQNVVMSKKMEIFLYFLQQQKCARTVSLLFILLCNVKNLIDNHVKLRAKLKYGHFIS